MIDWWMVVSNALWIFGLSVLVAALSYHDWLATATHRRRRDVFKERSWRVCWAFGMCLLCSGWGLSQASRWWERLVWFALAASFAWDLLRLILTRTASPASSPPPGGLGHQQPSTSGKLEI